MNIALHKKVLGLPNSGYHAQNDYDGRSFLVAVNKFGGPAQQWLDQGHSLFSGNNSTRIGSKFDTLITGVCEGKSVDQLLASPPASVLSASGARNTKAFREWRDSLPAGAVEGNDEELFMLRTMVENTLDNPAARREIEGTVETQVSVFFEIDGHRVKVRPDGCCADHWWDLKSTSSSWDHLYRSVFEFGYPEQEWLYVRGAIACGLPEHRMPFIFTQTFAPYACHVFYLPADIVEEAGVRMRRLLEEVRLRRLTGEYMPADHGEITEMPIPQWARKHEEEVVL